MATAPDIFTKSCTYNGTEPCLRIQTRGLLKRLTGLPTNWQVARIGMIASLTGAAGDNVVPVNETLAVGYGAGYVQNSWLFGLSDGVAFPQVAGKFVGMASHYGTNIQVSYSSSKWSISNTNDLNGTYPQILFTNGTVRSEGNYAQIAGSYMADPTAVADYCFGMVVELDCTVAGSLTVKVGMTPDLSRADAAEMSYLLNSSVMTTLGAALTGGWWSGSVPVACQYFFMRWPLSLNSMRVHNYDFIKLA